MHQVYWIFICHINKFIATTQFQKTFLTMLLLGYLKHYDNFILSHEKTNKTLDFIAKYSFGLFFIHWYWLFIYNQIFHVLNVIPVNTSNYLTTIASVSLRFTMVTALSLLTLHILKILIKKSTMKQIQECF